VKKLICISLFTAATMLAQNNPQTQAPTNPPGQGQPPSPNTDPNSPNSPPDAQTRGNDESSKKKNQKKKQNDPNNPSPNDQQSPRQ